MDGSGGADGMIVLQGLQRPHQCVVLGHAGLWVGSHCCGELSDAMPDAHQG